jgi:GT2 family glycosyltransferase
LKKALACYENQTKSFRNLIVVNNHSNDGTFEFLEKWKSEKTSFVKHVVNMDDNLGGSGGFYAGQKYAMSLNPDWIYLADDDVYAEPDMMEQFYKFCDTHDVDKLSAICGTVYDLEGKIAIYHRSTHKIENNHYVRTSCPEEWYDKDFFQINCLSYVCSFINANAIRRVGYVNPKYFIYYDDTEHSIRLAKYGNIVCVPNIKITHEEQSVVNTINDGVTWKNYYIVRNHCHMLKMHFLKLAIDRTIYMLNQCKKDECTLIHKKVIRLALRDAWLGILGKHKLYKPGWSEKL